jgi:heptose I phosphotransferase
MSEPVTDRFHAKQGRTIARWTLTSESGRVRVVFLKRHFILPRLHGVFAVLFPKHAWSPGIEEWHNLNWARSQGLPVPAVPAVGQWVTPQLRVQGFIAVEELHEMLGLHEAVPLAFRTLSSTEFADWKRGLNQELARLSRELHQRRAFHKDLYFCHFYVQESDTRCVPNCWRGRVVMIDFHRLGHHPILRLWYQVKDLAQLWNSSDVPGVSDRDRLRFWKSYRTGIWDGTGKPPDWLRVLVRWKWKLYQRQHKRRAARANRLTPAPKPE